MARGMRVVVALVIAVIIHFRGGDRLTGGSGRDRISGGKDDDVIYARDGQRDSVSCGTGKPDRVVADPSDRVAGDCENVSRRYSNVGEGLLTSGSRSAHRGWR